ncbi:MULTISPECIES: hypothetical protein [Providencia]|uniref:Poly A polymerase head domain-containing protein n=1 Tax=Providencia huaxiensis TaxID=2027290 RepID=A0A8I2AJX9_9GAMM|nr:MULTISPECIES: hypothetical protein [Providencia]MBQ0268167.1 hypothetical protein [Providencia huaxiensis]MBZ3683480.1 hypothetical protein [Providencia rettgeri]
MKKDIINTQANTFNDYLADRFPKFAKQIINVLLEEKNDVFLFSGIIRDYFLYKDKLSNFNVRDIDIVVSDIDKFHSTFKNIVKYNKNSFGGLKLYFNDINIDVWQANSTWGLNRVLPKDKNQSNIINILPKTVFFNCSSILFDFQNKKFIENDDNSFQFFLNNRVLDIVLEDNPLPELCVLNTIYYTKKYDLKISSKLECYVKDKFSKIEMDRFIKIQIKHFNKLIFEKNELENEVKKLSSLIR